MFPGDECLFALTECGDPTTGRRTYDRYPAYFNITRRAHDGNIVVTVRSRDSVGTGQIVLTPAQWSAFKLDIGVWPVDPQAT